MKLAIESKEAKVVDAKKRRAIKEELTGWMIGGWQFALNLLVFGLFPTVLGWIMPFMELHSFDFTEARWVGLANFKWLLTSPYTLFWKSLGNSLYYLLSVPIGLGIALFVAVQLDKEVKGTPFFRVVMFLPTFISGVATSIFWRFVFEGEYGLVNSILGVFGIDPVDFLNSKFWFMPVVFITGTWGACANSVLFQAALSNVNISIKEAAWIDGATEKQTFWKITFPAISPTTLYQLIMSLNGALMASTNLMLLANNGTGPDYSALTVCYYIYNMNYTWTTSNGPGMAGACGVLYSVFTITIWLLTMKLSKKWVNYD